jgi:hypothetical protein
MQASTSKMLRRWDASNYLRDTHGVSRAPSTLSKLAVIGGGPVFRHIGRVPFYSPDDLDAWVKNVLSSPRRSTSDIPAKMRLRKRAAPAGAQANAGA